MKVLVAIANYGTRNDKYLASILENYRNLSHEVDIVVTSNIPKNLGPDIEVAVGLPSKDPWSLGFAHKNIFAERSSDYDLFVYSEDDVLISEQNVTAFLKVTDILPCDEIAGFMRTEKDADGKNYFSEVRQHFHWDTQSVRSRKGCVFASFTAEHSACYLLTRDHLKRALLSGGYLVDPHESRYDLLVTAATDPYTQCGFAKMLCISRLEEFLIPHLSNKYVGKGILSGQEFEKQLRALLQVSANSRAAGTIVPIETKLYHEHWSKDYYESLQQELVSLVPAGAQTILSVGCGWGETEQCLMEKGMRVNAIPIDSVIAVTAAARGIEIVNGNLEMAIKEVADQRFDCILFSNLLHLVREPVNLLLPFVGLLAPGGCVIASVPNVSKIREFSRSMRLRGLKANPQNYEESGMHATTGRVLKRWLRGVGLKPNKVVYEVFDEKERADRFSLGLARPMLGSNVYVSALRVDANKKKDRHP